MLTVSMSYRGGVLDARQWLHPALRLLLLLTSMLILVMPVTESLWNWDRFLLGGSDVEFTLLAGFLFAALVLLAMERGMTQPLVSVFFSACAAAGVLLIRLGRRLLASRATAFPERCWEAVSPQGAACFPGAAAPLRI